MRKSIKNQTLKTLKVAFCKKPSLFMEMCGDTGYPVKHLRKTYRRLSARAQEIFI